MTKSKNCCGAGPKVSGRRLNSTLKWLFPGVVLAILPKCPLCFAAYFAAATGFGISFRAAADIRLLLIVLCIGSLFYLAIRQVRARSTAL